MKWWLGVLLLLAVAIVLESSLLAYAVYVLLGILLLSRVMMSVGVAHVEAERDGKLKELEVGEEITIQVRVRNKSSCPVPWVLLEDVLPVKTRLRDRGKVSLRGQKMKLLTLWGHAEAKLTYTIKVRQRGYYQIGPLVLESGDLFGLYKQYRVVTKPQYVLVFPQVVVLEGYDLSSRRPLGEIRLTHRLYEDPTRIAGVREYQQGDPMNRVHWRTTARTGTLYSKLYEPSCIAGATLVMDFHRDGYPDHKEPQRSEMVVTTAASIALVLYQMGQPIGLITNARDAADRIRTEGWEHDFRSRKEALESAQPVSESERIQPQVVEPGRGVNQFERIWRTLARVELTDGLTFDELLLETESSLARNTTLVAVLPRVTNETALVLGHLVIRGYAVVAILVHLEGLEEEDAAGLLISQGVEVRYVHDDRSLGQVCQQQVLR